jgi:DNA-binding SARP family transcriptional activator
LSIEYRLLGPLEVLVDGSPATLGGPRQRAVLVCLLARANAVVPAASIADDVWGDDPPETAANVLQSYISHLRKALGKHAIETRGNGYVARVDRERLDLIAFERAAHHGSVLLEGGRPEEAARSLAEALALWRGPALADLVDEPAVAPIAARLEELRVLALERRIEADLACGRHAEVVTEAAELVRFHPLRERPRWLHMLALYRSGRQAEALDSYRQARAALVDELGIEPGQALQELERAILQHDPVLDVTQTARAEPAKTAAARAIVVAALGPTPLDDLAGLAAPLAGEPRRELLLVRTVADASQLAPATALMGALGSRLVGEGIAARTAAFTSFVPGADLARLVTEQDADLVLVDAPEQLLEDGRVVSLLAQAPCDVGIVVGSTVARGRVFVPFGGGEHDWAAVELGAWFARSTGGTLSLAGALIGPSGRDSSRLLASASLAVQRALGVTAEPLLVEPEPGALVAAASQAALVCVGLPDRWQREGLGPTRTALAARTDGATILVRRGIRPGGLAPRGSETRFTWTIAG